MSAQEAKRLKRLLIITAVITAAAGGLLLIFGAHLPFYQCPFRLATGFYCPGCGNTRAAEALLHLRLAESLTYNYAYPLEFLYLGWVLVSAAARYVKKGKFSYQPKAPAVDYTLLALVLVWWVLRNVLHI